MDMDMEVEMRAKMCSLYVYFGCAWGVERLDCVSEIRSLNLACLFGFGCGLLVYIYIHKLCFAV